MSSMLFYVIEYTFVFGFILLGVIIQLTQFSFAQMDYRKRVHPASDWFDGVCQLPLSLPTMHFSFVYNFANGINWKFGALENVKPLVYPLSHTHARTKHTQKAHAQKNLSHDLILAFYFIFLRKWYGPKPLLTWFLKLFSSKNHNQSLESTWIGLLTIDTHYSDNTPFQVHTEMAYHANVPFPNRRIFGMLTWLQKNKIEIVSVWVFSLYF